MIYATYKYETPEDTFYLRFANDTDIWPGYKQITATYHMENAIKKAISDGKVKNFQLKVADSKNDYLRNLARTVVIFLRGQGFDAVQTEGF